MTLLFTSYACDWCDGLVEKEWDDSEVTDSTDYYGWTGGTFGYSVSSVHSTGSVTSSALSPINGFYDYSKWLHGDDDD